MEDIGELLAWTWLGVKAVGAVIIVYLIYLEIKTFKKKHKKPDEDVIFGDDDSMNEEHKREKQ